MKTDLRGLRPDGFGYILTRDDKPSWSLSINSRRNAVAYANGKAKSGIVINIDVEYNGAVQ